jgi:uncharacterized protein YdeI (BOF family)
MTVRKHVVLIASTALISSMAIAQTPIGELFSSRDREIAGEVVDVFGNKFVVSDATGRILVDAGPGWWQRIEVTRGERVRVTGELDEGEFDARTIVRGDGSVIQVRPADGPPPWAGGRHKREGERGREGDRDATAEERRRVTDHLVAAGYSYVDDVSVDDGRFQAEAISPSGVEVDLWLDMSTLEVLRERRS